MPVHSRSSLCRLTHASEHVWTKQRGHLYFAAATAHNSHCTTADSVAGGSPSSIAACSTLRARQARRASSRNSARACSQPGRNFIDVDDHVERPTDGHIGGMADDHVRALVRSLAAGVFPAPARAIARSDCLAVLCAHWLTKWRPDDRWDAR